MARFAVMLSLFITYSHLMAQALIEDPKQSSRCKELLHSRTTKLEIRQKSMALLERTKKLREATPADKKSILKKIDFLESEIGHKVDIIKLEIANQEEELIRRGCPTIGLL